MNSKILGAVLLLATMSLVNPVQAQEPSNNEATKSNPVADACIQNRAENLPNPFSDVPSDHWAFKAVMTMHYCGAFRQATPPALFQQLKPTENIQQPQREQYLQK
ncbi:S-layer protein [Tolypothrix sp. PCC 7910]|uniref:S-layer protein n=1 Tax=Tolypothrix sp. PCC 7910 TaxID=2099387 RepID=UPI0014279396|nr:S-layer protein [Tolypothrix sp. PCC 7910]QIR37818.1 S-layer protein [Tolypothrix sp. PCC 7910]